MNLSIPQLLFGGIGALLIYCAVTNQTPVNVIKGQKVAPGTNIDPVKTGQASADGSSGHNYDMVGTQMLNPPAYSLGAQNVKKGTQVWPV